MHWKTKKLRKKLKDMYMTSTIIKSQEFTLQ